MVKRNWILLALFASLFTLGCAHHGKKGHGHHKNHKIERWNKMDKNGDGKVTKAEFVATKTEKFEKMDSNKDGVLTSQEAMSAHQGKKKKCDRCK